MTRMTIWRFNWNLFIY